MNARPHFVSRARRTYVHGEPYRLARGSAADGVPRDCVLRVSQQAHLAVTGVDVVAVDASFGLAAVSGMACVAAANDYVTFASGTPSATLPCTSTVTYELMKIADLPSAAFDGAFDAAGIGAVLTEGFDATQGGTGSVLGTFDDVAVDAAGAFVCLAATMQFPTYALLLRTDDHTILIEFDPSAWTQGSQPVDGLSGAVWSTIPERAMRVAAKMRTGQVAINGGGFNPQAPFGGFKESGIGREGGRHGLLEFLETKSLQTGAGLRARRVKQRSPRPMTARPRRG